MPTINCSYCLDLDHCHRCHPEDFIHIGQGDYVEGENSKRKSERNNNHMSIHESSFIFSEDSEFEEDGDLETIELNRKEIHDKLMQGWMHNTSAAKKWARGLEDNSAAKVGILIGILEKFKKKSLATLIAWLTEAAINSVSCKNQAYEQLRVTEKFKRGLEDAVSLKEREIRDLQHRLNESEKYRKRYEQIAHRITAATSALTGDSNYDMSASERIHVLNGRMTEHEKLREVMIWELYMNSKINLAQLSLLVMRGGTDLKEWTTRMQREWQIHMDQFIEITQERIKTAQDEMTIPLPPFETQKI